MEHSSPGRPRALSVRNLSLSLSNGSGTLDIIQDISFDVGAGKIVGLVGESGSGKTLTALAVADLLPPRSTVTGQILLDDRETVGLDAEQRQRLRGSSIAMVFQDPQSALNPVFTVRKQIGSLLRVHQSLRGREAQAETAELLTRVGLRDPWSVMRAYPHELSGGMCQRVMIAMALACRPRLLIADEPTTSLDVTVQAQIIALLRDLVETSDLSVLFISHDLGVVSQLCSSVVVMYAGQVVESGSTEVILWSPSHPYTRALVDCVPDLDEVGVLHPGIPGQPPDAGQAPAGCRFQQRCHFALPGCSEEQDLVSIVPTHAVRCWRHGELSIEDAG